MPDYRDSRDFEDILKGLNPLGKLGAKGFADVIKNSQLAPLSGEIQEDVQLTEEEEEIFQVIKQEYQQEYLDQYFAGTGITDPKERERVLIRDHAKKGKRKSTKRTQFKGNKEFTESNGEVSDVIPMGVKDRTYLKGEVESIKRDEMEDREKHKKQTAQSFKVVHEVSETPSYPLNGDCPFTKSEESEKSHHEKFLDGVKEADLKKDQELYETQLKIVAQRAVEESKQ